MKFTNEVKAGLVIVVAIAIAVMFFLKTSTFQPQKYQLRTNFVYAGDLKSDAIVKLTGIEAGRVKSINFVYKPETRVECILELAGNAKVRKDSIAYIGTSGFVGDAYVGLTAGTSEEFHKPGETVVSEDPVQMRLLMKKADQIANSLDTILADVKTIVADNKGNIDNIILNLESTTENFKEFSEDVKDHPWKLLFKGE